VRAQRRAETRIALVGIVALACTCHTLLAGAQGHATTVANGASTTALARAGRQPVELNFRLVPLVGYCSFDGTGALMTLPFGVSLDAANHTIGPGARWFSVHASVYGPGINWSGIKNPRPFYPSVLGAISIGPRISWQYGASPTLGDGEGTTSGLGAQVVNRQILSVDLSLMGLATGEMFYAQQSSESSGPLSAGFALGATWIP